MVCEEQSGPVGSGLGDCLGGGDMEFRGELGAGPGSSQGFICPLRCFVVRVLPVSTVEAIGPPELSCQ